MKQRSFIFFFVLQLSVLGYSQQYNFHNYTVKDGIAQSQVYSLLQDSRGYLWIGTYGGGMSRFDGLNFKTFSVNDGLSNNYIYCIREDSKHNIWIGTNYGISEYNGISFTNYLPNTDTSQFSVQEIDFDSLGRKWLATNSGVILLDGKNFINVTDQLKEKRSMINAIHVDLSGAVWYGNAEGLFKITSSGSTYKLQNFGKQNGLKPNSITCIKQDFQGNIWIGTYGDGAYKFTNKKFIRIDEHLELYRQSVLDIYFDSHKHVWFATLSHGMAEYNPTLKKFSWLTENEGLSNNHIRCVIQDQSGNYWFGTSGGGVCNYSGKQFTNYDKSSGLGGNFIYCIYRDSKNRLWTGTSAKGLTVLKDDKFSTYNAQNGFLDVKVKCIIEDNFGNLFFGTEGQGVYKFNGKDFRPVEGLKKIYIRSALKDSKGNLWFATSGDGLYKLLINKYGYKLQHYTNADGLLNNRLSCMLYDKQGRLWYGTENNGIGYLKDDVLQKKYFSKNDGLPSNSIRCLTEDESGCLWIGTAGNGIAVLPLYQTDQKIKSYNHNNGLSSSNIYLLSSDQKNNLFVGTETGLDYLVLDKERKPVSIKHYAKGEGFTGVETCQNSVFKDADGTTWFGTINGLSKFSPGNLIRNENPPVTSINDVKLFYVSISNTAYKNFAGDWNNVSFIDLPYNQNHITFDFTAINFSNPEAVKYQWKLEGFDKEWSPVSKNHSILYSNLSAGNYTFLVKACNEDAVWNKEPARLNFHISPPIWFRWWFLSFIIISGCSLVVFVFKWRVNRIKAKASEEQKKLQLEKDVVELEQKALRLQMNPHFIFNALNSIQSQIGNNNEQLARYYLAKFSHLMRQILDNSRNSSITLEEEISTLENYLLIEKFCNGDRFDYKITADKNIEKDFVRIPPMLLQPFIENSIKHGLKYQFAGANPNPDENKRGMIEVGFIEINNILECTVTDNGIGRTMSEKLKKTSKETYHKSTALFVTQERLDLLKMDKNILSLEIVDLYDGDENPTGTKVIVRIPII